MKYKIFLILILCIFGQTLSAFDQEVNFPSPLKQYTSPPPGKSEFYFKVTGSDFNDLDNYIRIQTLLNNTYDEFTNFEISYSTTEENPSRNNTRYFYSQFAGSDISLYIPKSEVKFPFYIGLKASTNQHVQVYFVGVETVSHIELDRDNDYTHIIPMDAKDNEEIKIKVPRFQKDGSIEKYAAMTLAVSASKKHEKVNVQTKFYKYKSESSPEDIKMFEFREGKITTFNESKYMPDETDKTSYYEMTVLAEPGEIIKIDTKSTVPNNYLTENVLIPNEEGIMGLLNNELSEECFKIDVMPILPDYYYVNVMVYSGKAILYLLKEGGVKSNVTEIFKNGAIKYEQKILQENHFCISRPSNNQDTTYYLQVNDYEHPAKEQIFEPQDRGYMYYRILPENFAGFFSVMNHEVFSGTNSFYMRRTKGSSIMYYVRCLDFPYCRFKSEQALNKALENGKIKEYKKVHSVNGYFNFRKIVREEKTTPFAKEQDVMLVICLKDECEFETAMFNNNDTLNLIQNRPFYRLLVPARNELYSPFFLEVDNREQLEKLVVTISLFNGDVTTDILPDTEDAHFRYLGDYIFANKRVIEYEPKNKDKWGSFEGLNLKIIAKKAAYIMVEYYEELKEQVSIKEVETGVSVIHHIVSSSKGLSERTFKINRKNKNDRFVSSLRALNCRVELTRTELIKNQEGEIERKDTLIQPTELYFHQDSIQTTNDIEYKVKVLEMDNSIISEGIHCTVQFNNIEMMDQEYYDVDFEKEMAIPENYETQFIMNSNNERFKYMYPHTTKEGPVIFTILMEKGHNINAYIGFGNNPPKFQYSVGSKQNILLHHNDIRGEELCQDILDSCPIYIILNVTDIKELENTKIPVKVMVRGADETPSFIKKAQVKYDYLIEGSNQYFFTEVSPGEEGECFASFNRGSGSIYARLIPRNLLKDEDIENKNHTWHGKYYLPQDEWEGNLRFDAYDGRVRYDSQMTTDLCKPVGCYLLITLDSNYTEIQSRDAKRLFPVTLYFNEKTKTNKKYIDTPVDEFIVGTVNALEAVPDIYNHRISFEVKQDSNVTQIEFESDILTLTIRMDDINNGIIINPAGRRILRQLEGKDFDKDFKGVSLKGHRFYIEIKAPPLGTSYIGYYLFRARTPRKDVPDFIRTDSDQRTLCAVDDPNNLCYFAINLAEGKKQSDLLLLLALSDVHNNDLTLHVNIVEQYIIDGSDISKIKEALPTVEKSDYDSKKSDDSVKNFLKVENFKNKIDERKMYYAIVGVKASKKGEVSLLNNYYRYTKDHIPNPKSPEIIYLYKSEYINLAIPTEGDYMVHLRSIKGEGEFVYQEDQNVTTKSYRLSGYNDNLNLAMEFKTNLNVTPIEGEFAFYITYEPRKVDENFDEINYGTRNRIEIDTDLANEFPLYFYSRIPNDKLQTPVTFTCTLYDMVEATPENEPAIRVEDEFVVHGVVVEEKQIMIKKKDSQHEFDFSKGEKGTMDKTLKTGLVHFSVSDIERETKGEVKYLVIRISHQSGKKLFTALSAQVTVLPLSKDSNHAPYGNYIFGQIENRGDVLSYTLKKKGINDGFFFIEVGRNGRYTDFSISKEDESIGKNTSITVVNDKYGKQIIKVEYTKDLVFTVWLKEQDKLIKNTLNYVFKYRTSSKEKIDEYLLPEEKLDFKQDGNKFTIELTQAKRKDVEGKTVVMPAEYYVRFIKKNNFDEATYLRTIAFQNGESNTEFYFETDAQSADEKLKLEIDFTPEANTTYVVNVFCIIRDGFNWEFLTYKNEQFGKGDEPKPPKPSQSGEGEKKGIPFWVWIIIGVLAVVIIGFVVGLIYLKKRNKDLMEQVYKESFRKDDEGKTENGLLG